MAFFGTTLGIPLKEYRTSSGGFTPGAGFPYLYVRRFLRAHLGHSYSIYTKKKK